MDAASALAWVREEVAALAAELQPALPPADTPLCDFLRDGRALCLLSSALEPAAALPKNLQRSLHQTTTFHSLERVQFFIKWSRAALDAHLVFSSVQLLDERNDEVVAACLVALRGKFRPHLKAVAAAPVKQPSFRGSPPSDNQAAIEEEEEEAVPTSAPLSVGASSKLSAFLNKVPSKSNVLASAAAPAAAVAPVADVDSSDDDGDDNNCKDNNADEEGDDEEVEPFDEDEHVAVTVQPPRAALADAFSPRSSMSRSSLSFSFTSDPRGRESFPDEQQHAIDLSFSSVTSSPPASPKPPPRVRIPSIFERNMEKKMEKTSISVSTTQDTSSVSTVSSAPRDEATPRKLQIPSAFAASSSAISTAPPTLAPVAAVAAAVSAEPTAAFTEGESTPAIVEAEPAAPVEVPLHKAVSKLNIPSAFTRSASASSSKSDKSPFAKNEPEAVVPASPSPPVLTKKPSRLKIPSVFAAGSSATPAVTPPPVKHVDVVVESTPSLHAEIASATTEKIGTVTAAANEAPTTPKKETKVEAVPRSPFAAFVSSVPSISRSTSANAVTQPAPTVEIVAPAASLDEVVAVKTEEAPTTPKKEIKVEAVPRSPFAAFVSSTTPPSISRSTSNSSTTNPASKLAAFLSKVEPASTFVPTSSTVDSKEETTEVSSDVEVAAAGAEVVTETPYEERVSSSSSEDDEQERDEEYVKEQAVIDSSATAELQNEESTVHVKAPTHAEERTSDIKEPSPKPAAASKLAAFLSKVEPASPFTSAPSKVEVGSAKEVDDSGDFDDDSEEFRIERESESRAKASVEDDDNGSDSGESVSLDMEDTQAAVAVEDTDSYRLSKSPEIALERPAGNQEDENDNAEIEPESDVESNSSDEECASKEQFDERLSEDSAYDEPGVVEDSSDVFVGDESIVQHAPAAQEKEEEVEERLSDSSDASASADEADFEERISDASNDETDAAAEAVTEVVNESLAPRTTEAEVEHHAIDHHDHTDSEQPFFVVEEVSLSKPAASSKLYAFLNAVDSAPVDSSQTDRFSHNSAQNDENALVEIAEPAEDEHTATRSVSSHHSSSRNLLKKSIEETTTSERSEQTPRNSVTTASATVAVSSEVILEKERLSGENLALQQKLKAAEDELAAKESSFAALRAELAALKEELEASQNAADVKAKTLADTFEARLTTLTLSHNETLESLRSTCETAVREKKLAEEQLQSLTLAHESRVASLEERNAELEQQLQRAKDSEEAARYSAQVAFAARDEMEALMRSQ